MSKHTPAPWTIEYPMGDDEHIIVPAGKPTYEWCFIATVTATEDGGRASISEAEALANARLIAVAPELLSIAKRWAALDAGSWAVDRHAAEKRELLADTRAAIAKAEPTEAASWPPKE